MEHANYLFNYQMLHFMKYSDWIIILNILDVEKEDLYNFDIQVVDWVYFDNSSEHQQEVNEYHISFPMQLFCLLKLSGKIHLNARYEAGMGILLFVLFLFSIFPFVLFIFLTFYSIIIALFCFLIIIGFSAFQIILHFH